MLHLTRDSFADFSFHIIEIRHDPAIIDEPAKPVWAMAVREMKMIPDEICSIGLALLDLRIGVEVSDSNSGGIKSPQRNVFLFQGAVCSLFALVSAHTVHLTLWALSFQGQAERRP